MEDITYKPALGVARFLLCNLCLLLSAVGYLELHAQGVHPSIGLFERPVEVLNEDRVDDEIHHVSSEAWFYRDLWVWVTEIEVQRVSSCVAPSVATIVRSLGRPLTAKPQTSAK